MYEALLDRAVAAAEAGAEVLRGYFRGGSLEVRRKAENDFVTRADRESEERIVAVLREAFPDHEVLGEEGGVRGGGRSDHQWLVDPLDGTTNFLQGLPVFCVSVACRRAGELVVGVVLEPLTGDRFTARRGGGARWNGRSISTSQRDGLRGAFLATGYPFRAHAALDAYLEVFRDVFGEARAIRRCGAAALDLAYTAAGVYDGFFEFRLSPWDVAAGTLLVREAGGRVTDLDGGRDVLESGNVVAGAEAVQEGLLAAVRRHIDEASLAAALGATEPALEIGER